jgi:SAM-dependent methyltransferase
MTGMAVQLQVEARAGYLPDTSFQSFTWYLEQDHPLVVDLIAEKYLRDPGFDGFADELNAVSWEFEASGRGRGGSYNRAQREHEANRTSGMSRLLSIAMHNGPRVAGRRFILLDALAGDGTIQRYVERHDRRDVYIVSADLAAYMIECCREQNFPCLRQSATRSLIRENVLDAVLLAYGTHHIPLEQRTLAMREAHRTLAPGGRLVVHDFPVGSAMDDWFRDVVHRYSHTGHDHAHFTPSGLERHCRDAGFTQVQVDAIDDPFEATASHPKSARRALIAFLHGMYGLDRLPLTTDAEFDRLGTLVETIFGPIELSAKGGQWLARVTRKALVAAATK